MRRWWGVGWSTERFRRSARIGGLLPRSEHAAPYGQPEQRPRQNHHPGDESQGGYGGRLPAGEPQEAEQDSEERHRHGENPIPPSEERQGRNQGQPGRHHAASASQSPHVQFPPLLSAQQLLHDPSWNETAPAPLRFRTLPDASRLPPAPTLLQSSRIAGTGDESGGGSVDRGRQGRRPPGLQPAGDPSP